MWTPVVCVRPTSIFCLVWSLAISYAMSRQHQSPLFDEDLLRERLRQTLAAEEPVLSKDTPIVNGFTTQWNNGAALSKATDGYVVSNAYLPASSTHGTGGRPMAATNLLKTGTLSSRSLATSCGPDCGLSGAVVTASPGRSVGLNSGANVISGGVGYVSSGAGTVGVGAPKVVSSGTTAANTGSDACTPQCTWKCESQACDEVCEPVCEAPTCEVRCPSTPDLSKCCFDCEQPQCTVQCPERTCPTMGCPTCSTTCSDPVCKLKCDDNQPCSTYCEQPKCQWNCSAPTDCPAPKCSMVCEQPKNCLGSTYKQLPPLQAGEVAVQSFQAAGASPSFTNESSGLAFLQVAAKFMPHAASLLTRPQTRNIQLPVNASSLGSSSSRAR